MSKYLALDIGQVIYNVYLDSFIRKLNDKITFCTPSNGNRLLSAEEFISEPALQDIGAVSFKKELITTYGFYGGDLNQLMKSWESIIEPNAKMMNFIHDLEQNHNVKIALLSNIGKTHAKLIGEKFPETYENKVLHLSCEVGARKPTKLFYQSFLWDYPEFKGCLYIDDRKENLEMGEFYSFVPHEFNLIEFDELSELEQAKRLKIIKSLLGSL